MQYIYKVVVRASKDGFESSIKAMPIERETEKQFWIDKGHEDRRVLKSQLGSYVEVWNYTGCIEYKTFAKTQAEGERLADDLTDKIRIIANEQLEYVTKMVGYLNE